MQIGKYEPVFEIFATFSTLGTRKLHMRNVNIEQKILICQNFKIFAMKFSLSDSKTILCNL